jgi:iron-sulfur cluster repair protein YtfE (RIC family)
LSGGAEVPAAPARLSDELLALARLHPRETWSGHANLGQVAQFWLQRHDMFRRLDAMLREGTETALRDGPEDDRFKPWLARYLRLFLGQLEEHHQVEDLNYFPVFRRIEPTLVAGFELLERDHAALHTALGGMVERANALLTSESAAATRSALGRYHEAQTRLGRDLIQHLDDEEELVVPLLLERGEGVLYGG